MDNYFKHGFEKIAGRSGKEMWDEYHKTTGTPLFTEEERKKINDARPGFLHPFKRKAHDEDLVHVAAKRWHAGTFNADAKAKGKKNLKALINPNTHIEKHILGIKEQY